MRTELSRNLNIRERVISSTKNVDISSSSLHVEFLVKS